MSDFYKILVVGQSGKGKTYGSRTLDPATTAFMNIEDKPFPFKNSFKYVFKPQTVAKVHEDLKLINGQAIITTIVFDSFSAFIDLLLAECRAKYKNFDIWNNYNEGISLILKHIKSINKEIIVIAHYETLNVEGDQEKRVKVKGKEWEGLIEKEFTVVLYADRNKDDKGKVQAWLDLNLDASSSKCPPDIFGEGVNRIDNDYKYLIETIQKFAGR